ncbi:MAG TPA: hypothetical protein VMT34_10040 [Aggregatilineales bacterium]|nr:hypothetical protein [Aggregatilineales bacterium]
MNIDWSRIAPVIVSIVVIILIAIVRQYSKTLAAITVTMPLNIPLGMWIVYAGSDNHQAAMAEFSEAAMMNIIPTVVFLIVAWQLSKVGFSALQTIILGYVAWAVCLGLIYLVRTVLVR